MTPVAEDLIVVAIAVIVLILGMAMAVPMLARSLTRSQQDLEHVRRDRATGRGVAARNKAAEPRSTNG